MDIRTWAKKTAEQLQEVQDILARAADEGRGLTTEETQTVERIAQEVQDHRPRRFMN